MRIEAQLRSPLRMIAISLEMLSPRPWPLGFIARLFLSEVLKNGLKRVLMSSLLNPMPSSITSIVIFAIWSSKGVTVRLTKIY